MEPLHHGNPQETLVLTGAAGFIGRDLAKALADTGYRVVTPYLKSLPEPHHLISPISSDLSNPEQLASLMRGASMIVHAAWDHGEVNSDPNRRAEAEDAMQRNQKTMTNMIKGAVQSGCKRFVFLSTFGAQNNSENRFFRSKYQAERLLLEAGISEKIIVRLPIVLGGPPYLNRHAAAIIRLLSVPMFYPIPTNFENLAYVSLRDVTRSIESLCRARLPNGVDIVQIGANQTTSLEILFERLSERLSLAKKIPIRGHLGEKISVMIDRWQRANGPRPSVDDLFKMASPANPAIETNNPLTKFLPQSWKELSEIYQAPNGRTSEMVGQSASPAT